MSRHHAGVLIMLAVISSCKMGSNSNETNSPTSPSNTSNIQGTWTGTLTRPNGLPALTLRWDAQVKTDSNGLSSLTGPVTITGTTASTTSQADALPGGNDKIGYSVFVSFSEATPPSSCKVIGSTLQGADPYPAPYTTITVSAFTIYYVSDCRGLFDGATQQTNVQETAQLVLKKQ